MKAACRIRYDLPYRRKAFLAGLVAAGYQLVTDLRRIARDDVLVIWNRYDFGHQEAQLFEAAGAAVIVAENGYVGASENEFRKPFAADGGQLYALARSHHNGAGRWWVGSSGRWREQGIEVKPWRQAGDHILILPQRGIGPAGVAMPDGWYEQTVKKLRNLTDRPIKVREHPGNQLALVPLCDDLAGAWAVVTWGSGGAIKALVEGVPVFYDFPQWIGGSAALPLDGADLEDPLTDDELRERMLDRLGWAQWTTDEVASGEPFRRLLGRSA